MRVILINPYPERARGINQGTIEPPLGLAYLAAAIRAGGWEVDLIDANALRVGSSPLVEHLTAIRPDLVGISTNIVTHYAGTVLARGLRQAGYRGRVVLGGPMPSALPEYCLDSTGADAAVIGEGEETLLEIAANLADGRAEPFRGVRGCFWRDPGGSPVREEPRPLIADLDSLPLPAWDLLPPFGYYKSRARRRPIGAVICSRGCPYRCTYCNKSVFGSRYRHYSVERIIREVELLVGEFGIRQLDILDDNLTLNLDWAKELFRRLAHYGLAINLQNGIRADLCDEELLDLMKAAGVFKISMGVESGSPEVQARIKKDLELERVIRISRWARKRGIVVYGNFISGLPHDSAESMDQTIDFALRMDPDLVNFMYLVPLPGTEIWDEIEKNGKFHFRLDDPDVAGFYGSKLRYSLPGMDPRQVVSGYRRAYRRFYLRPGKILDLLRHSLHPGEIYWMLESVLGVLGLNLPAGSRYRLPPARRIALKSLPNPGGLGSSRGR